MKKITKCIAGFALILSSLGFTPNDDSQSTSTNWFSGNTIVIVVGQND